MEGGHCLTVVVVLANRHRGLSDGCCGSAEAADPLLAGGLAAGPRRSGGGNGDRRALRHLDKRRRGVSIHIYCLNVMTVEGQRGLLAAASLCGSSRKVAVEERPRIVASLPQHRYNSIV